MAKKKQTERGDHIVCPYCQRIGSVIDVFDDGSLVMSHRKAEWKYVTSSATGKQIYCEVLMDRCWRGLEFTRPEVERDIDDPAPVGEGMDF